jgi:hypothetical protein
VHVEELTRWEGERPATSPGLEAFQSRRYFRFGAALAERPFQNQHLQVGVYALVPLIAVASLSRARGTVHDTARGYAPQHQRLHSESPHWQSGRTQSHHGRKENSRSRRTKNGEQQPSHEVTACKGSQRSMVRGQRSEECARLENAVRDKDAACLSGRGPYSQWRYILSKREPKRPADCAPEMRPHN